MLVWCCSSSSSSGVSIAKIWPHGENVNCKSDCNKEIERNVSTKRAYVCIEMCLHIRTQHTSTEYTFISHDYIVANIVDLTEYEIHTFKKKHTRDKKKQQFDRTRGSSEAKQCNYAANEYKTDPNLQCIAQNIAQHLQRLYYFLVFHSSHADT